jgi:hypothetical protein
MSNDKTFLFESSTCSFRAVVSASNLSVSATSCFCRSLTRIFCCITRCMASGCDIAGIWFDHGREGAGSICPPLTLTEPAVTKTTPIIAIPSIFIFVSNQPGVIMLLLAMTSQAVKCGAFLFAADRGSYFRPMASLCASGEAFYPNSTGVGGILVASDSGLWEDFFRRRSS